MDLDDLNNSIDDQWAFEESSRGGGGGRGLPPGTISKIVLILVIIYSVVRLLFGK